jgi:hypothetical protein
MKACFAVTVLTQVLVFASGRVLLVRPYLNAGGLHITGVVAVDVNSGGKVGEITRHVNYRRQNRTGGQKRWRWACWANWGVITG